MSIWSSLASWAKTGAPSSSSVLNTGLQMLTNYQNRQNALKDQQRLNLYNSPQQQMQRFKEAGLNPNLIYSQQNTGQPVRSTDYVAPQIKETQLDVLGKSNQIRVQDQQLKNMGLQNDLINAQILKTKADALYVASNTKFKDLDYLRLQGQLPGLVEGVQLRNEAIKQEIANKVADTNNKIAQLPILEKQKEKIGYEIDRLMRTNAFIELNANQQLAVQKAMVSSIKVITDLNRKKVVTEDFNQEAISRQISKSREILQENNVDMSWLDKITDVAGLLLPYNMGKILPKFGK